MRRFKQLPFLALALSVSIFASGTEAAVFPAGGSLVPLLSERQRAFVMLGSSERRALFLDEAGRRHLTAIGDSPLPIRLTWSGGNLPVTVKVMSCGRIVLVTNVTDRTLVLRNLMAGKRYDWRVVTAGRVIGGSFGTESLSPRLIDVPGVPNFRDLGGWRTGDGRIVRQGMVFRSSGFNDDALTQDVVRDGVTNRVPYEKGAPRLTDAMRAYVTDVLGVRTDIDLRRTYLECYGMMGSPLGDKVAWRNITMRSYGEIEKPEVRQAFARIFRCFLDDNNYPIVFHCISGKDRTGTVAFLLNGLLGVSLNDLEIDWQVSAFSEDNSERMDHASRFDELVGCLRRTYGDDVNAAVESYVLSLGFTSADVGRFRELMLERRKENP